jgi:hypothetical protein
MRSGRQIMRRSLRQLGPSEAFDDFAARSLAAGAAGFFVFGCLRAGGALPSIFPESVFIASGMLAAFLTTLTLSLAYYHRRWKLGVAGALLFLVLPFVVNIFWTRFSGRSLIYPTMTLLVIGSVALSVEHRKISGPRWDVNVEDELIHVLVSEIDSSLTWKVRVTGLCFAVGAILLLILLFR